MGSCLHRQPYWRMTKSKFPKVVQLNDSNSASGQRRLLHCRPTNNRREGGRNRKGEGKGKSKGRGKRKEKEKERRVEVEVIEGKSGEEVT